MTVQDLKKWLSSREEEDVWWIQIAGETLGRKVNLGRIGQILDENIDSEVMVLHVSQATQRPRPWIEVERVKAAPVEKPHDVGLGRQTKGTHSEEQEPRPVQNFDFDSSRGSLDQTPVSGASPQSDLPTQPATLSHPTKTRGEPIFTSEPTEYEQKICVKCKEKTPHEAHPIGFGKQLLIAFPFLLIGTVLIGPLGGLGTLAIFLPISLCLNENIYKCDFCQTRYSTSRANKFIREHNRENRRKKWEESKH